MEVHSQWLGIMFGQMKHSMMSLTMAHCSSMEVMESLPPECGRDIESGVNWFSITVKLPVTELGL